MTPLELYDDHSRRPRNVGKLSPASAVGDVGSIVVGDALRLYLATEGECITAAKFQVFGANSMVASASALCELLPGRSVADAQRITLDDICRHLGGLDPFELPPQPWAIEALHVALDHLHDKPTEGDRELEGPLLCRCFGVAEHTIREAVKEGGATTLEHLAAATSATTGCGSCRSDVQALLDALLDPTGTTPLRPGAKPPGKPAGGSSVGPGGRIALMKQIMELVDEDLAGEWQAEGGYLDLWDFDGRQVLVRPQGFYARDSDACRHACEALERAIKDEVDPTIGVSLRG